MADTYVVQKGDTLSKIAEKLKMKLGDLIKYNAGLLKDKGPDKIKIGWQLKLNDGPPPEKAGGPIKGKGGRGYTVTYEDTDTPSFKPKEVNPESPTGRKASAPIQEDKWRKGKEIFDEVKTPVQIAVPAPPAPATPHAPLYFGDEGQALSDPEYQKIMQGATKGSPGMDAWAARGIRDAVHLGTALGPLGAEFAPLQGAFQGAKAAGLGGAKPFGIMDDVIPESAVSNVRPDIMPTQAMRARTEAALRAKEASTAKNPQFPKGSWREGMDDTAGLSNVRDVKPTGAKEINVTAPKPMEVNSSGLKSVEDWRSTLRSAADNTIVVRDADALGFMSPEIIITKGASGASTPAHFENILSAYRPVVTQGQMVKLLKYLGIK